MSERFESIPQVPANLPSALTRYWGKEIVEYRTLPWDEKRETPPALPFSSESQRELVEFSMRVIHEYLELPLIRDSFKTDEARAEWRVSIEKSDPAAFAAYEENMLRMNKIAYALAGVENLLPFLEWTHDKGLGALEAAHKEGLKNTILIWKKTFPPDSVQKLEFVMEYIIPLLQHVYDIARATNFTVTPAKPNSEVIEFGRRETA